MPQMRRWQDAGSREIGQHICLIYEAEEELFQTLIPFLSEGIQRKEKVICAVSTFGPDALSRTASGNEFHAKSLAETGQLVFLDARHAFSAGGTFDPDQVLEKLSLALDGALSEGYSGIRFIGEMAWLLDWVPGAHRFAEYEAGLDQFLENRQCTAMCLYDRRRFPNSLLIDALATHPIAVIRTDWYHNSYYIPPEEFLRPDGAGAFLDRLRDNMEAFDRPKLAERINAERALRRSEEKYRAVFTNASIGIVLADDHGHFSQVNAALAELLGYTPDELQQLSMAEVTHPKDVERSTKAHNALVTGKTNSYRLEKRYMRKDGGTVWADLSVSAVYDPNGHYMATIGVIVDITERKQAEKALRESEESHRQLYRDSKRREDLYRSLLNSSADAVTVYDMEGRAQYVNPSFTRIFGWTMKEVQGKLIDFVPESERESTMETVRRTTVDGIPVSGFETRRYTRDGRLVDVSLSASLYHDHEGNRAGMLVIHRDITEHKRAEEALRDSEERYRSVMEGAPDPIVVYDMAGKVTYLNPSFTRVFGWTFDELKDQKTDYVPEEYKADTFEMIKAVMRGESFYGVDTSRSTKSGDLVDVSLSVTVFQDRYGAPKGSIVCLQDVTQRKRAEEALRESEQRYRSVMEAAPDPIVVYDMDGKVTFLNPAFTRVFGWTFEELRDRKIDYVPQEYMADTQKMLQPVIRGENIYGFESCRSTKAGDLVDVSMSVAVFNDKFGAPKGSVVCLQDVTQRKRAEEALRRSEERFRAVFEGAQDLIYIKDVSLRYTHVNPAMEAFLGLKASRLMGRTDEEVFGKDPRKRIREVEQRVLAGQSIEQEHTRSVNGVSFTFLDIRVPLRNPEGVVVGMCGISRNITERKKTPPPVHIDVDSFPSQAMQNALERASYAAASDSIVLLLGESGTGKDFLARWIHDHSARANGPFFSINCAALPQELAESELFGHEAGAFTGASGRKRGLLELAEGGTLLLNEIGELPPALQSKLLSFLDTRSFVRVRGEKSIHVDARLMAATHRELKAEIAEGRFLMPLFYRLNVLTIELPPLSQRWEDIPLIIQEIMAQLQSEMQLTDVPVIEPAAMKSLMRYHWPGNVRELRNVLERALMISDKGTLKLELSSLSPVSKDWSYLVRFPSDRTLHDIVDAVTQSLLMEALRRSGGSRKEAAQSLGISIRSVFRYLKRFGLE